MYMNMKKFIILTVSAALGLMVASSCAKQLDVAPPNAITDEQIQELMDSGTDEQKEQIIGQIAAGMQQYFNYYNIPNVGTGALAPSTYCMQGIEWMRGLQGNDICIGRNSDTNGLCGKAFYENTFSFGSAIESTNKAHWYVNWLIINKANFTLAYFDPEKIKSDATYKAKFGPSYAAALMVRAYGYMCLMEEYTPAYGTSGFNPDAELTGLPYYTEYNPGQTAKGRSTAAYCWKQIIADLTEAASVAESSVGFTTGWENCEDLDAGVAYFLLARANILTQNWSAAITACDKIISSGKYSFIAKENWGGHNTGASMAGGELEFLPENNAFTAIKKNPETILGYNVTSTYNPHSESALCAHFTRLANPFGYYASSTCARIDDRLYNKIAAGDCRKDGWYPQEIVDFPYLGQTKGIVASYGALKFAATYGLDETTGAGHTTKDVAVGINDFTKFRYSEVVLMKAEAQAQSGADCTSTLNTLLNARGTSCSDYSETGLSLVQLQYRIEMWGENGREYYNNRRWGINVDRSGSKVHVASSVKINATDMICNIIEEEVQNNPNLNTPDNHE